MTPTSIKLKQELYSIVQAALGCVLLGLVLVGIGGTIYKVISHDGWIAQAFGRSLSAGAAALGSLALVAGLAWFSRSWTASPNQRTRASDAIVYGFACAGLLYMVQLWSKGGL